MVDRWWGVGTGGGYAPMAVCWLWGVRAMSKGGDPLLKTMSKFFWMCSDTALNIASSLEALSRRSAISWMVKGVTPEVLGVWVQLVRVGARQCGCGSFLGLTVTDHVQR
uniref:Uncharacterized protein n=1 Tax=Oryza glumipatula TaxID=40148 RepID=A0A0D9Z856_9ORYZ